MKHTLAAAIISFALTTSVWAQTTAFTYQGKLTDGGTAANGQYDLTFKLYASGGSQIGSDIAVDNVQVTAGIFTVNLDFGSSPFTTGTAGLLEIAVGWSKHRRIYNARAAPTDNKLAFFNKECERNFSRFPFGGVRVVCHERANHFADGAKVTGTVNYANLAGNVAGVVGIENGGTGSSTKNFVDLDSNQRGIGGNKDFTGRVSVAGAGVFSGNGSGLTNLNITSLNTIIGTESFTVPGASVGTSTLTCPTGRKVLGGGYEFGDSAAGGLTILQSRPASDGSGWVIRVRNGLGGPINGTNWAICGPSN